MRSGCSLSLVAAALFIFSVGGCAGVKQGGTGVDGGGTSGGPAARDTDASGAAGAAPVEISISGILHGRPGSD
jgi:hypothetical protein